MTRALAIGLSLVLALAAGLLALWLSLGSTWIRAQLGGTDSQLQLGYAYGTGQGVPVDQERAAYWYRRAAEAGDPRGQLALAARYDEGLGLPRDVEQASEWFRRAAGAGSAEAQIALAFRYDEGTDVDRDAVAALAWLRIAGPAVDADAQARLLRTRLTRRLTPEQQTEALRRAEAWKTSRQVP